MKGTAGIVTGVIVGAIIGFFLAGAIKTSEPLEEFYVCICEGDGNGRGGEWTKWPADARGPCPHPVAENNVPCDR